MTGNKANSPNVAPMGFDYSSVTSESVHSLATSALAEADVCVDRLVSGGEDVADTLQLLDDIADRLGRVWGETAFMGYVHEDQLVREAAREVEELLAKWSVGLAFRDDVYQTVSSFAAKHAASLSGESARFLDFTMRDLRKAGHELDAQARDRLEKISSRLVELSVAFEKNIAEDRDHLLVTLDDLDGLPDGYVDTLEPGPDEDTWIVTMAYPHVVPILDNASSRDLRRKTHAKFASRAAETNRPILQEAIDLRREVAGLFDQPSWAHHKLDDQMASDPERVAAFYEGLLAPLTRAGKEEVDRMSGLLDTGTGSQEVQVYDWRYYDTQLRKEDYGVDQSVVAEYFPLGGVLGGLLDITAEVFSVRYEQIDIPVWHPDVTSYAIYDKTTAERIAHFHMDLFPREGKYSHAAAFPLVTGRRRADGSYQQPVSVIVANFTKPTAERPSLLQHSEVVTFFHEFGHILHQTLTRAELARFAGTSTERDFVEAPSQIMEHWVWSSDVLARFARHHQTGEPIPPELVAKLTEARQLNVAIGKLRQIQFGMLDLELHGPDADKDLDEILRRTTTVGLFPVVEGTFYPASFGHLMAGYDAGYYGYLWSEVYGDDMFSKFEEHGLTSTSVGTEYRREILERGGTRDALEHIEAFLGREPNNRAFLAKLGID